MSETTVRPDATGATETGHIGLHVRDLDRSLDFYRGQLGLELVDRRTVDDDGMRAATGLPAAELDVAVLRFPETAAYLEVVKYRGAGGTPVDTTHGNPGTCHVGFYTDDLDETWATLERSGSQLQSTEIVTIEGGVFDGGKVIYCTDPDGIRIELLEGGAYLDGSRRDPHAVPTASRANEASHVGIHIGDLDRSLAFYVDGLGLEVVSRFVARDLGTRKVIGLLEAELNMAILRLPGTSAFFEVIEYQQVDRVRVDPHHANPGTCHLAFYVDDLDRTWAGLRDAGSSLVSTGVTTLAPGVLEGGRTLYCQDPDGIRVQLIESDAYLDGTRRPVGASA